MKNYVAPGENITLPAPYAVNAGDGALVGSVFGVAQADTASGADGVFVRRGIFTLAKTEAQAWAQGALVYWDDASKECTTVGTDGVLIGAAAADAADPSTTGDVLLIGAPQPVAAFVADASSGSAAEINALRDALIAAGLMASS